MKKTNRSQVRQSGKRVLVFKSEANLGSVRLRAIPFALAIAFGSSSSFADPAGAVVAAGQAAISSANGITTIQQMSDRAVVNWQSFNVNAGEAVKFVQPSSTAAILNRVTGGSVSNINGLVEGNGRVYLINPNGIVVGANGVVNVNGGFVASTKSLADNAFMSGGALVFTGESSGSIQILGKVQSAQGDVILIAPKIAIEKTGSLIAGQTIKLVAANEVELSNGKFTVKPKAGDAGQLTVEGALEAAKVKLAANNNNLGALAINTAGTIRATGTQTNPDGSISIIATGEGGSINISGNIRSEKGDGRGGAVTILADNGIRINGTINANSTDTSKVGGDIYIGRDVTTNKLARATDVSGATLLSNKGFVETSGDWLKTHNITVLAKEWLLDPTDINIVAVGTATPGTATVPGSGLFQDTTAIGASEVLKSTIENAINAGTSVTISTANGPGTGSGNITILTALSFNNTGPQDATFKLFAVNGITQNVGSTITAVGSKNVNIEMESWGRHLGVNANSASSRGIVINSAISTNGTVKIDGFNRNTGANIAGVTFNSGSSISAASFNIVGRSNTIGLNSHGVLINGGSATGTNFTATSNTVASMINGISLSNSNGINGGTNLNGTNINFNGGIAGVTVKGSNASTQLGVRISGSGDSTTVITNGNVTFGAFEPNSNFSMRAGSITANSGSLNIFGSAVSNFGGESITANNGVSINIEGKTTAGSASNAVSFSNMQIRALAAGGTAGNINITGTSSAGVAINLTPNVIIQGRDVTLKGTSNTGAGVNGTGGITATGGNVRIDGLTTSGGTGGHVVTNNNITASSGNIVINGTTATSKAAGVYISGGTLDAQNIYITGTSTGARVDSQEKGVRSFGILKAANEIKLDGTSTNVTGVGIEGGSVTATNGQVLIEGKTTNGFFQGVNVGFAVTGKSVSITGNSSNHYGVGIGATVKATDGDVYVKGTTSGGTKAGVYVGAGVEGKNVKMEGSSAGSTGVDIAAAVKATDTYATATGVILTGFGGNTFNNYNQGVWVRTGGSVDSVSKVSIVGTNAVAANMPTLMGTQIEGTVKAVGDINLEGYSTHAGSPNSGLVIQNTVTSTGGNITATASVANSTKVALLISGSGALIASGTNKNINMVANTMDFSGANATNAINAGGTVNINTKDAGTAIKIGVEDNSGASIVQWLSLNQTELNKITAAKTVIGHSLNAGGISVDSAVTTTSAVGDITLLTGGNIAVNAALTVGDASATKNLTLNGAGASSAITQSAAIKAAGLELLGANATHTLTNTSNQVGIIAANTKQVTYTNNGNLAVGKVNNTTGVTTQTGANITTQTGDLSLNESINNQTSGNVVVGAGVSKFAGETTGGDVKTISGKAVTHTNGNLIVYSGSASGAGLLSHLDSGLANLVVDGSSSQNVDTNVAFNNGSGITGSLATAQVMFREKVTITNGLVGTTVGKTYGDTNTQNNATAKGNLLAEIKTKLKAEPGNLGSTGLYDAATSGNIVRIAKSIIIDSLTGNLDGDVPTAYSTAGYLKANGTYTYNTNANPLTSTKYTINSTTFTAPLKVTVAQKPLTGTIAPGSSTYGDPLNLAVAGATSLTGKVGEDDVGAGTSKIELTASNKSTSGNLIAGNHTQALTELTGNDKDNYTFANVKGDYKVDPLKVSLVAQHTNLNYTGALLTQNQPNHPFINRDNVVVSGLATGTAVGSYRSALSANGVDVGNYDIDLKDGTLVIAYSGANKAPTPPETYTRIAGDVVNLAPVSFAVGVAPSTAAGDEADLNICYAWGQRNGGSVTVHTLLKPSYLGLRNAKTDTQEAMSNSVGSSSHSVSPCDHEVSTFFANADNI